MYAVARATGKAMRMQDDRDARYRRQAAKDLANAYKNGADHAARRMAEAHRDKDFKIFSDTQKASLIGWCGVTY